MHIYIAAVVVVVLIVGYLFMAPPTQKTSSLGPVPLGEKPKPVDISKLPSKTWYLMEANPNIAEFHPVFSASEVRLDTSGKKIVMGYKLDGWHTIELSKSTTGNGTILGLKLIGLNNLRMLYNPANDEVVLQWYHGTSTKFGEQFYVLK